MYQRQRHGLQSE